MRKTLRNYFVPHDGNEYKPHILQKTAVILMGVLVLLTFTFANLQALFWINSDWLISTILPAIVVDLTNSERDTEHLGALTRNETLDRAAQLKAEHMAKNSYFAHYAPDGTSPWYWFDQVSYDYMHAGENLAVHFSDSDEVVEAWMESPTHRANIMSGKYTEIGIGTARGEYQGFPTVFVVQLFGTPMNPQVAVATPEPAAPATQPVAAITKPDILPEPVVAAASEPEVTSVSEPEVIEAPETTFEPVEVSEDTTLLVSDTVETSQVPSEEPSVAGIEVDVPSTEMKPNPVTSMARIATQPQRLLNIVYAMTSLFVLGALAASVLIEIRRQHPVQIAYGAGLLAAMFALMYIHIAITSGALIA